MSRRLQLLTILFVLSVATCVFAWPAPDVFIFSSKQSSPSTAANYFGDGSSGALSTSGSVSLSTPTDGDMLVKNYTTLTINAGHTFTTSTRCKGLLVFVQGDCTINGTLSMSARGANINPVTAGVAADGLHWGMFKSGGTVSLTGVTFAGTGVTAVAAMGNMPTAVTNGATFFVRRFGALPDTDGDGTQSGGGGRAGFVGGYGYGTGVSGTVFAGGGGGGYCSGTLPTCGSDASFNAVANGGRGGNSDDAANGGGAGNPCGSGGSGCGIGTGGLLILLVGGNLTIGAAGSITADGSQGGGYVGGDDGAGGGGSGGGNVVIAYAGTYSNLGAVTANGGAGGASKGSGLPTGIGGGDGSIQISQVARR